MTILSIHPKQLKKVKPILLKFLRQHGDGRITHHALQWLKKLQPHQLNKGTCITCALKQKKLIGIVVFANYGLTESFTAVHKDHRNQKIGEKLLKYSLSHFDRLYTRVATDNLPSLKLCFSCGMTAFHLIKGPTGKPTFVFGGGNWSREEWSQLQAAHSSS